MQQGDYTSTPYFQFPHTQNPNPISNPPLDPLPNHYASAPPFSPNYAPSDYPSTYPSYPHNPDPIPITAPSYPQSSSSPNLPSFNNSPFESNPPYQPPSQPYYPPYDQHQTASNYPPPPSSIPSNPNSFPNPNLNSNSNSNSSLYNSAPYLHTASSVPPIPSYDSPYESPVKSNYGGGAYFDDSYGGFNRSRSDLGSDLYGKRHDSGFSRFEGVGGGDEGYGDGVYAYQGGKVEPYGARGTAPKSSNSALFDDYGRSISVPSSKESSMSSKIVKAVPKVDTQEDVKSGVQKFRVKLLAESGGMSTMDVLCQV